MNSAFRTPICELLGCEAPIVLAGMGGVARPELVAAVSEAGGFGFLGAVGESPDFIRSQIALVRAATRRGFGVSFIHAATQSAVLESQLEAVITEHIAALMLSWDRGSHIARRLRDSGCRIFYQIDSEREAEEAEAAGAHVLVAPGAEAGGHLVSAVIARVDVPVLVAGDFVDGKALAAALGWGAQGIVVGTGFFVHSIPSAAERLDAVMEEAKHVLGVSRLEREDEDVPQFSSPACSMQKVSDAYMGYADKAELTVCLNELLEAERAGARVTLESARAAGKDPLGGPLQIIQRDEARWCAMLARHLKSLGAEPSSRSGAFYGKAMAIAELRERVVFLNRGQGWVVRKLRELLPRVRDTVLHADLADMLRSHEVNIDLANGFGTAVGDADD